MPPTPYTDEQLLYFATDLARQHYPELSLSLNAEDGRLHICPADPNDDRGAFRWSMARIHTAAADMNKPEFTAWLRDQLELAHQAIVAGVPAWQTEWAAAKPLLMPRIETPNFARDGLNSLTDVDAELRKRSLPFTWPLSATDPAAAWRVLAFIDTPKHMTAVSTHMLETWQVPPATVLEQAIANLRAVASPGDFEPAENDTRLLLGQIPDYATSRLLVLPELIQPWPTFGVLAAAPSRDFVIVLPLHDEDSAHELPPMILTTWFAWLNARERNAYPISPAIAYFDGTEWETLSPVQFRGAGAVPVPALRPGSRLRKALAAITGTPYPADALIAVLPENIGD